MRKLERGGLQVWTNQSTHMARAGKTVEYFFGGQAHRSFRKVRSRRRGAKRFILTMTASINGAKDPFYDGFTSYTPAFVFSDPNCPRSRRMFSVAKAWLRKREGYGPAQFSTAWLREDGVLKPRCETAWRKLKAALKKDDEDEFFKCLAECHGLVADLELVEAADEEKVSDV